MITLVGGVFFALLLGAAYWMEARRGGRLRAIHELAAVTVAFLLALCGKESRRLYIPALILVAGTVFDYVRSRRQAGREGQKQDSTR